jgi:hypothetical protein
VGRRKNAENTEVMEQQKEFLNKEQGPSWLQELLLAALKSMFSGCNEVHSNQEAVRQEPQLVVSFLIKQLPPLTMVS